MLTKQTFSIIIAAVLALAIASFAAYYYIVKKPSAPQAGESAQSLGGELFEKSAAPIGEKIQTVIPPPSTNPFETVDTNPFKNVYKNPFE